MNTSTNDPKTLFPRQNWPVRVLVWALRPVFDLMAKDLLSRTITRNGSGGGGPADAPELFRRAVQGEPITVTIDRACPDPEGPQAYEPRGV